jgi:ACS family allantoate permease-like MFS transporter
MATPNATEKEMAIQGEETQVVDAPPPALVKHIDEKILKHSHDADAAMKAFEGYEGQVLELSEETNKRLLRKIDMHLMPVS